MQSKTYLGLNSAANSSLILSQREDLCFNKVYQNFHLSECVIFRCAIFELFLEQSSVYFPQQTYILAWTKDGGRLGPRVVDDGQGGLVFTSVTPEDAGTYTCTGSTFEGVDTDRAVLAVGGKIKDFNCFLLCRFVYVMFTRTDACNFDA